MFGLTVSSSSEPVYISVGRLPAKAGVMLTALRIALLLAVGGLVMDRAVFDIWNALLSNDYRMLLRA